MMSFDKSQMVLFLELSLRPTKDSHLFYRLNGVSLTESSHNAFNRREFIHGALAGAAFAALPISAFSSDDPGLQSVLSQIPKMHDENVKRLQDWIALPSIAAENRNYPQGPDYMAQLARDAGFANVEIVPTSGKPGVFGTLDAAATTTVGIYFMYDVKQFDPSEWSSPPLEGRIVGKEGLGRICVGRGAGAAKRRQEIGSTHFPEVVHQPKVTAALKQCMGVFIPEAGQDVDGGIQISLGAKGVVELELVSSGERWGRGPKHDVHSSLEAQVDSPAWHLVQALNTLIESDGHTPAVAG